MAMMVASALVLLLETVFFHVLVYINSYIQATAIISVALLGIAIGGLLAYALGRRARRLLPLLGSGVGVTVVLCIVNLVFFPQHLGYPLVLVLPFLVASMVIATLFAEMGKHAAYFWNLVGAAAGVVAVCVLVPRIRSENVILTGIAVSGVLGFVIALRQPKRLAGVVFALLVLAFGCSALAWNLKTNVFDFGTVTRCPKGFSSGGATKTFCRVKSGDVELAYARDSLVGRVDVLKRHRAGGGYTLGVYQEGVPSDIVEPRPPSSYEWDCRLPKPIVLDPTILVIGTSAEGVTKTARHRSHERTVGVEINPAIVDLMRNELYEYSKQAYDNVELHVTDARTYLEGTDRQFDLITMMNTHTRGRVAENAGLPQYLFTEEAFALMFDRLTDRGAILVEEVLVNDESREVLKRILASAIAGLRRQGVEDNFGRHFYAFTFRGAFFLFAVKKRPFSDEELEALDEWMDKRAKVKRRSHPKFLHPKRTWNNPYARLVRDPEGEIAEALTSRGTDLSPPTDDRPFLYDIDVRHPAAWRIFVSSAVATLVLVLMPSVWLFVRSRRTTGATGLRHLVYFSLIGVAFMLVEIVLMQQYQLYLGSPVYALMVVLTCILLFSGVGSLVSGGVSERGKKTLVLAVPVLLVGYRLGLPHLFGLTQGLPFAWRLAVAVASLFPLFFCMGVPFPFGLSLVDRRFSSRHVTVVYGVNGAFGTIGVTLSVLISIHSGFALTFYVGIVLYLLAFVTLRTMVAQKPASA